MEDSLLRQQSPVVVAFNTENEVDGVLAALKMGVYLMRQGDYITDYEVKIGNKVAEVLCGGNVSPGTPVSEQYILDLEREAFKSLCGERKTQERIQYTLKTGKTLRN